MAAHENEGCALFGKNDVPTGHLERIKDWTWSQETLSSNLLSNMYNWLCDPGQGIPPCPSQFHHL